MDRLTEVYIDDNGGEFCALVGCKEVCEYGWAEDESGCRCDKVGEMQIRLAAYEDIGTSEQCAAGVALMQKQEQGLVVEWIPTEWEEPNQIGTRALIYPIDDEVVLGEYLGEGRWRWFNYVIPGEDLTHWMPLTAPPQAENAIAND